MRRDSAFSLIEVLFAWILLSLSLAALNKVLMRVQIQTGHLQQSQSLALWMGDLQHALRRLEADSDWSQWVHAEAQKLRAIVPQSLLRIERLQEQHRWVYIVHVEYTEVVYAEGQNQMIQFKVVHP